MPLKKKHLRRLNIKNLQGKTRKGEVSVPSQGINSPPSASAFAPTPDITSLARSPSPSIIEEVTPYDISGPSSQELPPTIVRRRISDFDHVWNEFRRIARHGLFSCGADPVVIETEERKGLVSVFRFKCKMCGEKFHVSTDPVDPGQGKDLNFGCVKGIMSIGAGYSQLEELTACINMPCMSKTTYDATHEEVAQAWHQTALEEMRTAAEEERRLAIEKGDVGDDGIPFIKVVVDGAWSKRSYKTRYDALSGVGTIIGYKTRKVLHIGVRNKYCRVCARGDRKPHSCNKNWDGPSTAMEADIILEGFQRSVENHGLRYTTFVGDGDSSVYKVIKETRPYRDIPIKKIGCRNHILRNYSTKIRKDMYDPKRHRESRELRVMVKRQEARLRSAVAGAVFYHSEKEGPLCDRIQSLRNDILNGPNHVFGDHSNCASYFCDGDQEGILNRVPELKQHGVYDDIMHIVNEQVAKHANSLIHNVDSNRVEHFNSFVAKFVGGKRINFSLGNSYTARCFGAVVAFNSLRLHSRTSEVAFSATTDFYTAEMERRREQSREQTRKRRLENREKSASSKRRKRQNTFIGPEGDEHYGPFAEQPGVDSSEISEGKKKAFLQSLTMSKKQIAELQESTKTQSENPDWMNERRKRLTASNFGRVCRMRSTTNPEKFIDNLLNRSKSFQHVKAIAYGRDNEESAIKALEQVIKQKVEKCGLFIDHSKPYLGASPDGLVGKNYIVEAKCPYLEKNMTIQAAVEQKKIKYLKKTNDGTLALNKKHQYWYQIQGQLHVTRRRYCYFVVWTPSDTLIRVIPKDDDFWKEHMEQKLDEFYMTHLLPALLKKP